MNSRAVILLSGGLDSTLSACILQEQGIELHAVNFQTMFGCCKDDAREVAEKLGIPFSFLRVGDDYLKVIERPKYGYGRGINPCVDCRIYMFFAAKRFMEQIGASFLVSGEVVDQRPMSQKPQDFRLIERDTALEGLIVRPLSAKRLLPTEPEKCGIVDRERLYGIQGRSRQLLLELAAKYGIENPPSPSAGCALTVPAFARKVRDVFEHRPDYRRWEFELLKMGRHFRLSENVKVIIARNQEQNQHLEVRHPEGTVLLTCTSFAGPHALLIGSDIQKPLLEKAGRLMLRYAQKPVPAAGEVKVHPYASETYPLWVERPMSEEHIERLRIA